MKLRLWTALVVVSLLVVGCMPEQKEEPTPTPIPTSMVPDKPTYVVEKGTVQNQEQFTARVSPLNEEELFFKRGGYVKVVYVEKGDWVEEGTLLAELEIDDLLSQLALAEVDLEGTQKQYDLAVEAHERQLFSAQTTLEIVKLRLARAKLQEPIVDYTLLNLSVQRAEESLAAAKLMYKEALDRPWEPQSVRDSFLKNITNQERSLSEAQARRRVAILQAEQAAKIREIDLILIEMDVSKAEQEIVWLQKGVDPSLSQRVETAQLRVERLQAQIETGRLIAPFAGEVLSLKILPGEGVEARERVAVIADPSEVDIAAELTSGQMGLMEEGQRVEVTLSSAPGEVFQAVIKQLPYPYGTGGGKVQVEDQDERVHMELLNPDEVDLEAGDLVRATVLIEQSENTLYLPPAAIRTFEGRKFVMVKVGDRLQKVDVKLGIEGEDRVEILDGLEEGQIIEGL